MYAHTLFVSTLRVRQTQVTLEAWGPVRESAKHQRVTTLLQQSQTMIARPGDTAQLQNRLLSLRCLP
jgi:hypothetical protein